MTWILRLERWSNSIGTRSPFDRRFQIARSVLALATLVTLAFNSEDVLFHASSTPALSANCAQLGRFGAFCLFAPHFDPVRWCGMIICLLVIAGFAPALTSVLHWYISASLFANAKPVDGGDQIGAVLAFIVACCSVSDWRLNAWTAGKVHSPRYISANVFLAVIPVQMAIIYFNSSIAKFSAPVWAEGSGLWYWVQHPGFNASPTLQNVSLTLLSYPG